MRRLAVSTIALCSLFAAAGPAFAQSLDPAPLTQPDGWMLPDGDRAALEERGAALFDDPSIGDTGASCSTCHVEYGNYNDTFLVPYPHFVAMGENMAGMEQVTAAEMVQLCMVVPMASDPLPWDSPELAALTAFVEAEQKRFAER